MVILKDLTPCRGLHRLPVVDASCLSPWAQASVFLFNVLQFVRHNRSDAPCIVIVIRSSTRTTKIFIGFPCCVSEVVARGLLHQLPQEADFSCHGVVFSNDALKSAHLIDMDSKRRLGVMKLTLEITDGHAVSAVVEGCVGSGGF